MPGSGPSDAGAGILSRPGKRRWILLPLAWLLVAGAAAGTAALARSWLPYLVGGGLALLWLFWVLAAALSPGGPDRRCPRCREEKLAPIEKGNPLGIQCSACGYRDPQGHVAHLSD